MASLQRHGNLRSITVEMSGAVVQEVEARAKKEGLTTGDILEREYNALQEFKKTEKAHLVALAALTATTEKQRDALKAAGIAFDNWS